MATNKKTAAYNKLGWSIFAVFLLIGAAFLYFRPEIKSYAFQQTLKNPEIDEFCIVHSYSIRGSKNEARTPDGRIYALGDKWNIWADDGIYAALFLRKSSLIKVAELPRQLAESILDGQKSKCINKKDYKG